VRLRDGGLTVDAISRVRLSQALDELSKVQMELDAERVARVEAEAGFDELVWSMSDALLLVDPKGLVTRTNAATCALLGRPAEELEGVSAAVLLPADVPATPWALLERHASGRFATETVVDSPGGARPVSLSGAVIRNRSGRIAGGVFAARDLTETQRLVGELAAANQRWELLGRTSDLLAAAVDPVDALPAIAALLDEATGTAAAFILAEGTVVRDVVTGSGGPLLRRLEELRDRQHSAGSALEAVLDGRSPALVMPDVPPGYPLLGVEVDGIRGAVLASLPAQDERMGALLLVSDRPGLLGAAQIELAEQIAGRVGPALGIAQLRGSLARHAAQAEARRAREDLLSGVSHDMKTPLTVISGFVDLLAAGEAAGMGREEVLAMMRRQTRRLQRLVGQFLDFVRLEADRGLSLQRGVVDLRTLLEDVVSTVDNPDRVRLELPENLPAVESDAQRLDQVFANLLTNALKFSPADSPVVVEASHAGRIVRVGVIDHGPGIDPLEVDRLFEKFTRGTGATSTEGSGLGLYVTKLVVDALDADLRIERRRQGGTRAIVSLPSVKAAA
jgi:PAS domain S-box-containing protein